MSKVILHSYFRSSASWRVRIALAYKGIDYEYKAVNLVKDGGQQFIDEYKNLNPMAQVPTLVIDGVSLTQSLPIIEYLEETRPGKSLLPKDPIQRAVARQIAEMINSGIQPLVNLAVGLKVESWTNEAKKIEWSNYWIARGYEAVEKVLTKTAGKFCVGDEMSIADVFLVPQMYGAIRFKVDLSKFPTINRVVDECKKLEAFKAADANCQPDTPEEFQKQE